MNMDHSVIRCCFIKSSELLAIKNVEEGKIYGCDYELEFEGVLKNLGSFLFDLLIGCSVNFNYSFVFEEDFGSKDEETGQFTGCYGSLYRNESDLSLVALDDPFYDYDKVNPYQILMDYPLSIAQAYNATDTFISVDIFKEGIHSFPIDFWILIFETVLFFAFILFNIEYCLKEIKIKLKERKKKTFSQIFNSKFKSLLKYIYHCLIHLLNTGFMEFDHFTQNCMSFLLIIFSFLMINYFCNLMATEMVVVPKPLIHESYSDLIERNIVPYFPRQLNEYLFFKNADQSSDMKILWDKSIERVGNASALFLPEKYDYHILDWTEKVEKMVIIMNKVCMAALKSGICQIFYMKQHLYPEDTKEFKLLSKQHVWDVPDPSSNKLISKVSSFRQTLERDSVVLTNMKRIRHFFEAGISHYMAAYVFEDVLNINQLPVEYKPNFEQISLCKSNTLQMGVPETKAVMVKNLSFLLETCCYLLITSTIALFIEILIKKRKTNRVIVL